MGTPWTKGPLATPGNDQIFNKSGMFGQPHQSAWENLSLGGFSTTLTPTPSSAQLNAEAEALAKRDLESYDKAQAKIKAGMEELKRQQDEIAARWNSIANQMGSSFTDALVGSIMGEKNAFKNLGKSILNQLLSGWVDRLITQPFIMPIINSMSGLFGYGGAGAGGMAAGAAQSAAGAGMGSLLCQVCTGALAGTGLG